MKKWLKLSLWIVLIVLVGIQFVPVQRNEIEPVTNADFIEHYESPIVIGNIIRASCLIAIATKPNTHGTVMFNL